MSGQRFAFANYKIINEYVEPVKGTDDEVIRVECLVQTDKRVFSLRLSKLAHLNFAGALYSLCQVTDGNGRKIWRFNRKVFDGISVPVSVDGQLVIASVQKGKCGKVVDVIPFTSFHTSHPEKLSPEERARIKVQVADILSRSYILTEQEVEAMSAAFKEERREREAKRKAKYARKAIRRATIQTTSPERATSVAEPEKISVQKQISRDGSVGSLSLKNKSGEIAPVKVFPTMDSIRSARAEGLIDGQRVTANDQQLPSGQFPVYQVGRGGVKTLGNWVLG
ncbi:hypothetical protein KC851_00600 [Candidatus Kaiserbacteria bacterium]|nr:hypothetical protein [Candidatus Kaiserbacteria bacterium]